MKILESKKYRLSIAVMMLFLISITSLAFNLGIAPTSFELDLKKSQTREVTVINNTDKAMRVEIFPEKPKETDEENYLGEYIRVYPKIITVKPFGKQVVKFAVRVSQELEKGEYKSYLVFRELPEKPASQESDSQKTSLNIQMLTEIAISIYGTKR